ncbi:MAG: hypothetical protein AB8I08_00960 [Sandaracinaceae bacterium]
MLVPDVVQLDDGRVSRSLPLAAPDRVAGRDLLALDGAPLGPDAVVVSRGAARGLTSVHRSDIQVPLRLTKLGWQRFTFDLPGVDPATLTHLDERGLVRVGTEVRPGMVLVGQTTPTRPRLQDKTAAGLNALFGIDPDERDSSRRCAPTEAGVVTRVTLVRAEKKGEARAEVELTIERPLEVGDLLFTTDGEASAAPTGCCTRCSP